MSTRAFALAIAMCLLRNSLPDAYAVELGVTLSGTVTFGKSVYEQPGPIGNDAAFARLIYDSQSPAIYNLGSCDCATYRQHVYNGMSVEFGPLVVRADEYDIHVINDFAPGGGADFVRIVFSSGYSPPFETPIIVNGVPMPTGQLVISLRDSAGAALNGSWLPELSELQQFGKFEAFLREAPEHDYVIGAVLEAPTSMPLLSGDFNQDGSVDGADLLIWQRSVGMAYPSPADGDRNRVVDSADLALWNAFFGAEVGSIGVPLAEPAALGFAMPLLLMGMLRRK